MHGIKETKDAIFAINILSIYLIKQFKDGIQFSDFISLYQDLMNDSQFKEKMADAYIGIQSIPEELKDLDAGELIELISLQLSFLPEIIERIKK